ncbi:MAG TPA: tetratricopeptide repeat protein [Pyrinomonadaceae bacterium]|nr:tetratricopeptide repeat protein [Pyrinomonadaceae bacterium]
MIKSRRLLLTLALLTVVFITSSVAQSGGGHMLYGDFKVDESKATGAKPLSFEIILYENGGGRLVSRQTVVNNSHYRFMEVMNGDYVIVVEVESNEVARIHLLLNEPFRTDIRKDIELEWRENLIGKGSKKAVATADIYKRTATNEKRFVKAEKALDEKDYAQAVALLREILKEDVKDYQSWSELGTAYLMQNDFGESEAAYLRATEANPTFFLAFLNLGKLRMAAKKFETAVEPLSQAVKIKPESPEANYLLGEAYLQIKKGSKAVTYLYEALKLDPIGRAEAHLRLAALYNGAGMKDKAAAEYEEFLKKKPDYPDRKKLEQYITQNKKL